MATARGVGTMTPLPVSSQNRAFAHMTSLLSSRTCRYSGPSAGTGLWSPIKCGEIFRSNQNHLRLLALILDKQDKQTLPKWRVVINTLSSCLFWLFKVKCSKSTCLTGNVWRISGAFVYLVNNKNPLHYTDLSHMCDAHNMADRKGRQGASASYWTVGNWGPESVGGFSWGSWWGKGHKTTTVEMYHPSSPVTNWSPLSTHYSPNT